MGFFDFFSKKEKETLDKGLEKTKSGFFSKLARIVVGRREIDDDFDVILLDGYERDFAVEVIKKNPKGEKHYVCMSVL